jgi:hypothetical protein
MSKKKDKVNYIKNRLSANKNFIENRFVIEEIKPKKPLLEKEMIAAILEKANEFILKLQNLTIFIEATSLKDEVVCDIYEEIVTMYNILDYKLSDILNNKAVYGEQKEISEWYRLLEYTFSGYVGVLPAYSSKLERLILQNINFNIHTKEYINNFWHDFGIYID